MIACPACGLSLPGRARFCARCGRPVPGGGPLPARPNPVWAIVVLALGTMVTGLVAAGYSVILADPELATAGGAGKLDSGQVRLTSALLAGGGAVMSALQLGAIIGLARGRDWARVLGSLAAAGWALTCVGLPVAVLLLHLVWRRPRPGAAV
jgi:hypothetical protein